VHAVNEWTGIVECGAGVEGGKPTTHGAVACERCREMRGMVKDGKKRQRLGIHFDSKSTRQRAGPSMRDRPRVTNTYRAARYKGKYLAHWTTDPRYYAGMVPVEHRLYDSAHVDGDVTLQLETARRFRENNPDVSPIMMMKSLSIVEVSSLFCPECGAASRHSDFTGTDSKGHDYRLLLETEDVDEVSTIDPTIHETGYKLPTDMEVYKIKFMRDRGLSARAVEAMVAARRKEIERLKSEVRRHHEALDRERAARRAARRRERDSVIALNDQGMDAVAIAKELNLPLIDVRDLLQELSMTPIRRTDPH